MTAFGIETKVIAATAGGGAGAALSSFLLWALGVALWGAPASASHASDALAAVPAPVSALVAVVITVLSTAVAGYAAPHTSRPAIQNTPPAAP